MGGSPGIIQNSMYYNKGSGSKITIEHQSQRFKSHSTRPNQKSGEVVFEENKNLVQNQNFIKIPTNNLMKNLVNQKT
jgi:hypothetical protein